MIAIPKTKLTPEEYLELERNSEERHEFLDGEIFALAGADRNHNIIVRNLDDELNQKLKDKKCEAYAGNLRVFAPGGSEFYAYPDLVVVCGEPQFQDDVPDTLLNPILIVEVLSETTEAYDRGRKFKHYRGIYSLEEYILVSHDEARIEKYIRTGDDLWLLSESVGMETKIWFEIIDCTISLSEVYDKVDFSIVE